MEKPSTSRSQALTDGTKRCFESKGVYKTYQFAEPPEDKEHRRGVATTAVAEAPEMKQEEREQEPEENDRAEGLKSQEDKKAKELSNPENYS